MKRPQPRQPGQLPQEKFRALQTALRQEWATLVLRVSIIFVLYLAIGGSQALVAIWLKSLWSLLPPAAFLIACRIESYDPTPRFPYGFYRAGSIAFMTAALALTAMGLFLMYTALHGFIEDKAPGLATFAATNSLLQWSGWPILAALAYSVIVPLKSERRRRDLAVELHDKGLYADATMAQVSWRAGAAAAIGVLGIGLGMERADYAATLLIALDILWHGMRHLYTAVCDLIDEVPRRLGSGEIDPLGREIREYLQGLDWIVGARVRLREEGRLLTGIALVCPQSVSCGGDDLVERFEAARAHIEASDWRLLDFELVPVDPERWQGQISRP